MGSRMFPYLATLIVIGGGGIAISRYVSPTEEQWYNNLSPDLKKRVDEIKAKKAREQSASDRLQQLKQASRTGEAIWQPPPSR